MKSHILFFSFELRRCFSHIKKLLLGMALLCILCSLTGYAFYIAGSDKPSASKYTVVFAIPKDAGIHYNLALGIVSNMDSIKSLCTVKRVGTEEEAQKMLDNQEASAAVIIPDGLIRSIINGSNVPARILYPGNISIETVIFRQLADSLSKIIAHSQAGIYSLYDIYSQYGMSEKVQDSANTALNDLYIDTALNREGVFKSASVNDGSFSNMYSCISGAAALLFLMSGIILCDFLFVKNHTLALTLKHLNISPAFSVIADTAASSLCAFCVFGAGTAILAFVLNIMHIENSINFSCIPGLLLIIIFCCSFELFICSLCKSKHAAIIATFILSFLLIYCCGSLMPSAFIPDILNRISVFLPSTYLCSIILDAAHGRASLQAYATLSVFSSLLICCSCIATLIRSKQLEVS